MDELDKISKELFSTLNKQLGGINNEQRFARKIVNHINSTPRKKLEGRTPYQVADEQYGEDMLNALQLRPIPPDDVTLTPKLLKK